jgi:hypothetical protein
MPEQLRRLAEDQLDKALDDLRHDPALASLAMARALIGIGYSLTSLAKSAETLSVTAHNARILRPRRVRNGEEEAAA